MPTSFGALPVGSRFDCTIDGTEFAGYKTQPFKVLKPERTSYFTLNALLIPRWKQIHGSGGFVASISDSMVVYVIAKAA